MKFERMPGLARRALLAGAIAAALAGPASAQDSVPRDETLVVFGFASSPEFAGVGIANPYMAGNEVRSGIHNIYEPLFYYNSFRDELTPWLATGYSFNDEFTELNIDIRDGVKWSDGVPFTAADVAYTLTMLKANGEAKGNMLFAADMAYAVESAEAVSDKMVRIKLKQGDPRFVLSYLASYFDRGMTILPAHVFSKVENPAEFTFNDPEKGWPISTGAFRVVRWQPTQIFLDRRDDWWAAETGFHAAPEMRRVLLVPRASEDTIAQALVSNNADTVTNLEVGVIKKVLERNPDVTTFTGRKEPFGYQDAWPTSVWFNTAAAPFNDPRVRKAIGLMVNREQVIEVVHQGASEIAYTPLPAFGSMTRFVDSIKDVIAENRAGETDLAEAERLLKEAGWTRGEDGFWKDATGKKVTEDIHTVRALLPSANIIAEQLRLAGLDVRAVFNNESRQIMQTGNGRIMVFGHLGGVADPYPTLDLYHGRRARPIGEATANISTISRMANPEYDAIVDKMRMTSPSAPEAGDLFRQAMEIWYRETPDSPVVQFYLRTPMNTKYWTNWPSEENPYIQAANQFRSFSLLLYSLKKAAD